MIYVELFFIFLEIGAFTFGGGYAMLPLIQEQVTSHGWMTQDEVINFIAVSESTPGPLAVNMATYVGMETGGFPGAVLATTGVVLPSFLIILVVAKCFAKFQSNRIVKGCMSGLRPAVIGLIAAAVISTGQTVFFPAGFSTAACMSFPFITSALILASMLVLAFKKIHPIAIMALSAGLGIGAGYLQHSF